MTHRLLILWIIYFSLNTKRYLIRQIEFDHKHKLNEYEYIELGSLENCDLPETKLDEILDLITHNDHFGCYIYKQQQQTIRDNCIYLKSNQDSVQFRVDSKSWVIMSHQ